MARKKKAASVEVAEETKPLQSEPEISEPAELKVEMKGPDGKNPLASHPKFAKFKQEVK